MGALSERGFDFVVAEFADVIAGRILDIDRLQFMQYLPRPEPRERQGHIAQLVLLRLYLS